MNAFEGRKNYHRDQRFVHIREKGREHFALSLSFFSVDRFGLDIIVIVEVDLHRLVDVEFFFAF